MDNVSTTKQKQIKICGLSPLWSLYRKLESSARPSKSAMQRKPNTTCFFSWDQSSESQEYTNMPRLFWKTFYWCHKVLPNRTILGIIAILIFFNISMVVS